MIGVSKPRLKTSTLPSDGVSKQQGVTDLSDSVRDTSHRDGTLGPSPRQQPVAICFQDEVMPVGDACREDGTLKEASEMVWLNSPSDENSRLEPNKKRSRSLSSELEYPDSPSKSANIRSKHKHDESGRDSEEDKSRRAKVSEYHAVDCQPLTLFEAIE